MSDNIKLTYTWDQETYLKASRIAYEYELKHSAKKYLGWLFIALTQFGVVAAVQKGTIGLLLVSTILVIYWYALRWPLRKYFISKSFDKSPNANKQFSINATTNDLIIDNNYIDWDKIDGVIALSEGIFIYLGSQSIFIPNKSLDIDRRNDLLRLFKENVPNYTKGL